MRVRAAKIARIGSVVNIGDMSDIDASTETGHCCNRKAEGSERIPVSGAPSCEEQQELSIERTPSQQRLATQYPRSARPCARRCGARSACHAAAPAHVATPRRVRWQDRRENI